MVLKRDLKPENILLRSTRSSSSIDWSLVEVGDIQIKITDFGLAKFYHQDQMSFTMTVAGTPFYMCPRMWEALLGQQPFRGHWSIDQFSMGVISYELMAGDRKQDKCGYSNASGLKTEFRGVDADIADFLIGMLHDDPNQRKSAKDLLRHPFIKKGQEHLERQRTIGRGDPAEVRATNDPTLDVLKRQVAQLQQEKEQSKQAIARLQGQQANMERLLNEFTAKINLFEAYANTYESRMGQLESKVKRAEDEVKSSVSKADNCQTKISQLESRVSTHEDKIKSFNKKPSAAPHEYPGRFAAVFTSPSPTTYSGPVPSPRPRTTPSVQEQMRVDNDLLEASKEGNVQKIKSALDLGANIECKMALYKTEDGALWSRNSSSLIIASGQGHTQAVEYLLSRGSDVHATDCDSSTALHIAAAMGHDGVISVLLNKGANINERDQSAKYTPLHWASSYGRASSVRLLLQRGADVTVKDGERKTALDCAGNKFRSQADAVKRMFEDFEAESHQDMVRRFWQTHLAN